MLCQYVFNIFIPQTSEVNLQLFVRMLGDIAVTTLFFSLIINVMYEKHRKSGLFSPSIINGVKRFPHLFLAYLLLSLPILLTLAFIEIAYRFWVPYVITQTVAHVLLWGSLTAIGLAVICTIVLFVFSFLAGIYIAIKKENVFTALKHSWKVIQPFWLDTLLLMIILGMIYVSLDLLLAEFQVPYAYLWMTLMLSSFSPALMLTHWENIKKASFYVESASMLKALAIK